MSVTSAPAITKSTERESTFTIFNKLNISVDCSSFTMLDSSARLFSPQSKDTGALRTASIYSVLGLCSVCVSA